jgi:hypothetical protein
MKDNLPNEGEPRKTPAGSGPGIDRPGGEGLAADPNTGLGSALDYLGRGFAVVPQRAGAKKPCVRWKDYQGRLPTQDEVSDWFTHRFPDAGVAVVLGPVSNLFVLDVDGPEAHAELIARLGGEPVAPKVLSGSGKPFRYHLFFRHPGVPTRARITPWHPKLEFRGHKGIVVLPPSLHKSGVRYRWAPGRSLDDVALPDVPAAVLEALSERAARDAGQHQQAGRPVLTPAELSRVQRRARAYLVKLPPAVEGQGGDKQTFAAACHLVVGFDLSPADALPLLREYNERCRPPWSEAELLRKLHEAEQRPGPRGTLLKTPEEGKGPAEDVPVVNAADHQAAAGVPFVGPVPDFVLADWYFAGPQLRPTDIGGSIKPGRERITGLQGTIHLAVISQRSARVVLPDVLLAQVFWGGDRSKWPANWRQFLRRRLEWLSGGPASPFIEVRQLEKEGQVGCPEACVLNGTATHHRHFSVLVRTEHDVVAADRLDDEGQPEEDAWLAKVFLGALELYGFDTTRGERVYDFTLQSQRAGLDEAAFKALAARIRKFRSKGRLVSVYLPLRLFGG